MKRSRKTLRRLAVFISVLCLTLSIVLSLCACDKKEPQTEEKSKSEVLFERGDALAQSLINKYCLGGANALTENNTMLFGSYSPQYGYNFGEISVWHYTSVIAMCNRMMSVSTGETREKYSGYLTSLIDGLSAYKGSAEIVSYRSKAVREMYAVNRGGDITGYNSVYDDQMWLIREFFAAYENTGKEEYLTEAERLTDVCLDGWDDTVNPDTREEYGGITWGAGYTSKHTCSNAPIVSPLVDLYEFYKEKDDTIYGEKKAEYYLNWAKKIYAFSYKTFKNDNDLYGDLIGSSFVYGEGGLKKTTSHGDLDTTQYTYNTGTMISAGARLYSATGDKKYLEQAQNSAEAAYRYFGVIDEKTGLVEYPVSSTLWFNFQLLLGFVDLAEADDSGYAATNEKYVSGYADAINHAYDCYNADGILPRNYVKGWIFDYPYDKNKDIMDCAASAETYALLCAYYS